MGILGGGLLNGGEWLQSQWVHLAGSEGCYYFLVGV